MNNVSLQLKNLIAGRLVEIAQAMDALAVEQKTLESVLNAQDTLEQIDEKAKEDLQ